MSLFSHRPAATAAPVMDTQPARPPELDLQQPTDFATATFALG